MKTPQKFDPNSNLNTNLKTRPTIHSTNSMSAGGSCSGGGQSAQKKSPAIPKGMPSITDNHKQISLADKKPFQAKFLHPKYWGIWLALLIVVPLVYLPLSWQFAMGKFFGTLVYKWSDKYFKVSHHKVTLINLKLAFANKSETEREKMARQVFINQGIGVFETLCAWFRPNIFTRTVSIKGLQHLVTARNEGKAVILLSGHYTLLDLVNLLCTQFFSLSCVYRPQDNDLLEWFFYNRRRNIFNSQIDHQDMQNLDSQMKAGHVICYSPDQNPALKQCESERELKQGVMADFFSVDAPTDTFPRDLAQLGDKSNPPVVMALHTYRETPDKLIRGKRPHYHITITPVLTDYPSPDEVVDATQVNKVLENLILIDPTQWMWFHKRYNNGENGKNTYYD